MRKITASGLVETYDEKTGRFSAVIETSARGYMRALVDFVGDKQYKFTIGKYYSSRTTGKDSQSHHIWGHCQQIAVEQGIDIETVHEMAKIKAISWGYPFDIAEFFVDGEKRIMKVAWSETRINTKQAGILIEVLHWMAAEMGIILYEGEEGE